MTRNVQMAERIERTPVAYPFRFVVAGDSGACCVHGLAVDHHVRDGVRFVMSGGGGTGLCSHFRGVCTAGPGHPEDRGALYHAVELTISESGESSVRVIQAFAT